MIYNCSGMKWEIWKTAQTSKFLALSQRNIKRNMLIGEHLHTLDTKKRISLPAKFRKELGKKIIITRGLDRCLFIYSEKEWKKFAEKLEGLSFGKTDSRDFKRYFMGGASEIDIDGSGRILIPDNLKELADLKTKVVVTGVSERVELWDEEVWNKYKAGIEKKADQLAEKLGDVGMI